MPVYNGQTLVAQAIRSLLDQTFSDFELIISDNGSTDRTPEICQEFATADHRIRYIRHAENRGIFWNNNFVISEARGRYFMLASDDDIWDQNWLELVRHMDGSSVICFGELVIIEYDGKVRFPRLIRRYSENRYLRLFDFYLRPRWHVWITFGIFETSLAKQFRFREDLKNFPTGDIDFIFSVLHHGNVKFVRGTRFFKRDKINQDATPLSVKTKAYWENLRYSVDLHEAWFLMEASPDPVVKVAVWLLFPVRMAVGVTMTNAIALRQLVERIWWSARRWRRRAGDDWRRRVS